MYDNLKRLLKANNSSEDELYGNVKEVIGRQMRGVDRMGVYLASLDPDQHDRMTFGGISEADIKAVVDSLSPVEKTTADFMLAYYKERLPAVQNLAMALDGRKITGIPNYSPMPTVRSLGEDTADNMLQDMFYSRYEARGKNVETGFLIERKGGKTRLKMNALGNFLRNVGRIEHALEFATWAKKNRTLFDSPEWSSAAIQEHGESFYKEYLSWFEATTHTGNPVVGDWFDRFFNVMRSNAAVSLVGGSPQVVLKHLMSFTMSWASMGPKGPLYTVEAAAQLATKRAETMRMIDTLAPQLQNRFSTTLRDYTKYMNEMAVHLGADPRRFRDMISKTNLAIIGKADRTATAINWLAAFNEGKGEKNMTQDEAISYANGIVEKSHIMARQTDLPGLFRSRGVSRLLTLFQNQPNQNFNLLRTMFGEWKSGEVPLGKTVLNYVYAFALPAYIMGLIAHRGRQPSFKELVEEEISYPLGSIAFFGTMAANAIAGYSRTTFAPFVTLQDLEAASKAKSLRVFGKYATLAAGTAVGLPVPQAVRTASGALDLATGRTTDISRLGWSSAAIKPENFTDDAYVFSEMIKAKTGRTVDTLRIVPSSGGNIGLDDIRRAASVQGINLSGLGVPSRGRKKQGTGKIVIYGRP